LKQLELFPDLLIDDININSGVGWRNVLFLYLKELKWTVEGQESVIITYCRLEERKTLLTSSSRELHEDVDSIIGGLFRPESRDALAGVQKLRLNTTILFDCELTKRISACIEIYINLQKHRKASVYAGLWVVVTFRSVNSLARIGHTATLMPFL